MGLVSDLRRFQRVGASARITPFSGNPLHPDSLPLRNSPPPILQTSLGLLHFSLQPLLGDLVGKLVDTLHDYVKQVVDVHGRSLLVLVYALTYRRDGESVGHQLNFFMMTF